MSRRRRKSHLSPLEAKLEHLDNARNLANGIVDQETLDETYAVLSTASDRRSLSSEHTVIGFFGATGSGKSALFNAVSGQEFARSTAIRPTTSAPMAAIWGSAGAAELLDWLQVHERHVVPNTNSVGIEYDEELETGLILLDLPDFDSIKAEHREIVTRMHGQVDVAVWVLDPQKYADAALHHDFLIPMARHDAITVVVLNQADTLPGNQLDQVMDSLRGILTSEGLAPQHVVAISATTGMGVEDLRKIISSIVSQKQAATLRMLSDIHKAADDLMAAAGGQHRLMIANKDVNQLVNKLAASSHVNEIAAAAGGSYRHEARKRTGWAFTRWIGRLRVDPLQRMHLKSGQRKSEDYDPAVHRSSLPTRSAASTAQADSALREFLKTSTADAPEPWQKAMRENVYQHTELLEEDLDQAVVTTDMGANSRSWWWYIFNTLQWIAMIAAIAGLGWLLAYPLASFAQLTLPDAPVYEGWPVPTLLLVAGAVLGIILALTARLFVAAGAKQRQRKVAKNLRKKIAAVVETNVLSNLRNMIERYHEFNDHLQAASRGHK